MKTTIFAIVFLLFAGVVQAQKPHKPAATKPRDPVAGTNYQWRHDSHGQNYLSFSVRNDLDIDLVSVKYRIIFYDKNREPVDYLDGEVQRIPAGLAVHQEQLVPGATFDRWKDDGSFRLIITSKEAAVGQQ